MTLPSTLNNTNPIYIITSFAFPGTNPARVFTELKFTSLLFARFDRFSNNGHNSNGYYFSANLYVHLRYQCLWIVYEFSRFLFRTMIHLSFRTPTTVTSMTTSTTVSSTTTTAPISCANSTHLLLSNGTCASRTQTQVS